MVIYPFSLSHHISKKELSSYKTVSQARHSLLTFGQRFGAVLAHRCIWQKCKWIDSNALALHSMKCARSTVHDWTKGVTIQQRYFIAVVSPCLALPRFPTSMEFFLLPSPKVWLWVRSHNLVGLIFALLIVHKRQSRQRDCNPGETLQGSLSTTVFPHGNHHGSYCLFFSAVSSYLETGRSAALYGADWHTLCVTWVFRWWLKRLWSVWQ